jgi:hypothetical protein
MRVKRCREAKNTRKKQEKEKKYAQDQAAIFFNPSKTLQG